MHQKNFVICDTEQDYAQNLLQMLTERKELQISLHLFQNVEQLELFASRQKIHFLIFDGEISPEHRSAVPAEKRFVLTRKGQEELCVSEIGVDKYQSIEDILNQIFCENLTGISISKKEKKEKKGRETLRDEESKKCKQDRQSGGRLIGVYSPIHRIGKTRFAIEMGKELAKKEPVLYLNLEGYAGGSYFQEKLEQDLGSLLYYARQESDNLGLRISMMAGQLGGMDYIEPIAVIQDLHDVQVNEWQGMFDQILSQCIYEVIILDLSDGVNGLYDILAQCETVYTPYVEEPAAMAKLQKYTENLIRTGYEAVLEHTIQKKVILN